MGFPFGNRSCLSSDPYTAPKIYPFNRRHLYNSQFFKHPLVSKIFDSDSGPPCTSSNNEAFDSRRVRETGGRHQTAPPVLPDDRGRGRPAQGHPAPGGLRPRDTDAHPAEEQQAAQGAVREVAEGALGDTAPPHHGRDKGVRRQDAHEGRTVRQGVHRLLRGVQELRRGGEPAEDRLSQIPDAHVHADELVDQSVRFTGKGGF